MRYLLILLFSLMNFISISQDSTSQYYLEKATKIDTTQTQLLYFNNESPQMVVIDSSVYVLFTMNELAKMNEKLQMIPIMEEVIEKYGAETEVDVGVISSLENEIYLLKKQVSDKEGRIIDLNSKLDKFSELVENLQMEASKNDEVNKEYETQIKSLKKDLRKQKVKTIVVAIGEGAIIVILLIVLL